MKEACASAYQIDVHSGVARYALAIVKYIVCAPCFFFVELACSLHRRRAFDPVGTGARGTYSAQSIKMRKCG